MTSNAPAPDLAFRRELVSLTPDLRARAMRLALTPAAAEDLLQDTFERALRFAEQYDRTTSLRAWTQRILFSVFVTRYRRVRRERVALGALGTDPNAWPHEERFGPVEASSHLTCGVRRALEALPDGYRQVVELVDLEEHTYREAADTLGVPIGTVMSRIHRARKMLASALGGWDAQTREGGTEHLPAQAA
jgi:RNA polymerase sigma-70 factor (ECF subfamily)